MERQETPARRRQQDATRARRPCDQRPGRPARGARVAGVAARAARVAASAKRGLAASAGPPPAAAARRARLPAWAPSRYRARRVVCCGLDPRARAVVARDAASAAPSHSPVVAAAARWAPPLCCQPSGPAGPPPPTGIWLVRGRDAGSVTAAWRHHAGSPRAPRGSTAGGCRQRAARAVSGTHQYCGSGDSPTSPFPLAHHPCVQDTFDPPRPSTPTAPAETSHTHT